MLLQEALLVLIYKYYGKSEPRLEYLWCYTDRFKEVHVISDDISTAEIICNICSLITTRTYNESWCGADTQ